MKDKSTPQSIHGVKPTPFMGKDPTIPSAFWREHMVQAYVVMELRRMGYVVHGDGNGVSATPKGAMQKAICGAMRGWPDLCILLPGGRVLWVELKMISKVVMSISNHDIQDPLKVTTPTRRAGWRKGAVSVDQKKMAKTMEELGHDYHVVYADCPHDGLVRVMGLLGVDGAMDGGIGNEGEHGEKHEKL